CALTVEGARIGRDLADAGPVVDGGDEQTPIAARGDAEEAVGEILAITAVGSQAAQGEDVVRNCVAGANPQDAEGIVDVLQVGSVDGQAAVFEIGLVDL